jgi:formylglycine-generating enzyme required for sulfatase activity/serine/threonine protein kinase
MTPKQPTPQTPSKPGPFDTADPGQGATPSTGGSPARLRLEPGERPLPEYVLVRELGSGGFGQVWLAQGPGGFEVALKFLKLGEAAGETELKAMQMMKGIRHANLLALFGVWETGGWLVVAMELADRSLMDRLKEAVQQGHGGIPRAELLEYMRDAARGLDFLADKGMIHRDVKPHNLFLSGDSVKVADYGLAKVLEKSLVTASTKMTPAYSAPEFFSGKTSKWSDQYCLAVSYCHLRGNRLPFTGDLQTIMAGHLLREPDLSMLPLEERPVVAKAMAKEPSQRWPSCKAFVEALTTTRTPDAAALHLSPTDELTKPQPIPTPPRRSRTGLAILLFLSLLLGGAGLLLVLGLRGDLPLAWLSPTAAKPTPVGWATPTETRPREETKPTLSAPKPAAPKSTPTPTKPVDAVTGPTKTRPALAIAPFAADAAQLHQQQWADSLGQKVETVNSIGMKFRLIPPGEFLMGSPTTEAQREDDEDLHRVRLTKPYYLGTTEVTQEQYEQVMGRKTSRLEGSNLPVETVSWFDCVEFCNQLSAKESKKPCYRLSKVERKEDGSINTVQVERLADGTGYRLPTEAEWEYACRAGTAAPFHHGDSLDATQANFEGRYPYGKGEKGEYRQKPIPVGSFQPNAFGLYDMHGNLFEWCQDYFDADFYKKANGVANDPVNEQVKTIRVLRGGSWFNHGRHCRCADRFRYEPGHRDVSFGFRVVLAIPTDAITEPAKSQPPPPQPQLTLDPLPVLTLKPGERQTVTIRIRRQHFTGPVELKFAGVPAGVTVPPSFIPEGRDTVDVEVIASNEAKEGNHTIHLLVSAKGLEREGSLRLHLEKPAKVRPALALAPFPADKAQAHQQQWADYLGQKVETVNSIGMKFRLIPPGEFDMGSWESEAQRGEDEHRRRVRLTQPFYLGSHEVTQAQYDQVMGQKPSRFKGANLPVENVSWEDAQAFLTRLNELEKGTGRTYRLPTEAEWEYACRAGTTTPFHYGGSLNGTQANCDGKFPYGNSVKGPDRATTTPVGTFAPNAFGLHDMHGNVWEWCQDAYRAAFTENGPAASIDPVHEDANEARVLRGGSWSYVAGSCRSAQRNRLMRGVRDYNFGFRVVAVATLPAKEAPLPPATNPPASKPTGYGPKPALANAPFSADAAKLHQQKWADYLGQKVEMVNSIGMKFRLIPPGEFDMGSPEGEKNRDQDEHRHRVRLTQPFYLGATEVTQEQFELVLNRKPSRFHGANLPVEHVTWFDGIEFCNKLSEREEKKPFYRLSRVERNADGSIKSAHVERLTDGTGYRLPTEAEWEYACRAGTASRFCFGDEDARLVDYAWHDLNADSKPHPVGQKKPNVWGLHDMHGNVWEWCQDYYKDNFYKYSPPNDPVNEQEDTARVLRGASWYSYAWHCRCTNRTRNPPDHRAFDNGFRVASAVPRTP